MLLKYFKGTRPRVISLIVFTLIIVWINAFLNPQFPGLSLYETNPMPLYGLVISAMGSSPLLGVIFSVLLSSLIAFLLVNFNTTVFFINERTFLPAAVFILITGQFPENQVLNPVLPATVFLLLALMRIMAAYRKPDTAYDFFDAGILIGIGSLFYCNLMWFMIIVYIGIALLRPVNLVEIAISLLGFLTPFLITAGIFYVVGKNIGSLLRDIQINIFGDSPGYRFGWLSVTTLVFIGFMMLTALAFLLTRINSQKIKSRKTFYLLLWTLVISLALYIVLPSVSIELVWIAGIPASYILTHYFVFVRKKIIPEVIFAVFFLLILLVHVLNYA